MTELNIIIQLIFINYSFILVFFPEYISILERLSFYFNKRRFNANILFSTTFHLFFILS